jgi:signal transduction histidine kinase
MEQLDVNTTSAQVEALIEREAIEELYRRVPTVIVGMLIVTPIIIVGIWPYHSPTELLGWLLAIYLAVAQRYIGYRKFSTEGYDAHSSDYWGYYYSLGSFLLGGLLGFGTFIFFYPDSLTHQLVLYIIIIGLTISGINTNSVWPRAYYIYVTSSIGLMASRMLLEGSSEYTAIGMAMLLYIGVASSVAKSANKTFRRTVMLHVKNAELVEQLRQEKQRVEIANQAKTRFLAAASHDLRQPVHSMALFVEALRTEVNTKNGKSLLDFMQSAMDGLNQLLSSLLDISRLDAGVIKPTLLPLSINTLLTDLYNELSPFAQEKGLTLHLRERHETVSSDPVLLANIIRNLLVNAIRYTTKGKILLACRKRRDRLLIQVWDTGPGIPEHELERIFIEFQQLDNPERDRSKGLGLGLAICQRLAKLLGHHLTVHSRVGHGTVFLMCLSAAKLKIKQAAK